ncbi:MAG: methyltransferase [Snowella sp.]|jgi:SAM-dependent methyltransferase|nr:MAG: methyltransferase [Snowella sp.]
MNTTYLKQLAKYTFLAPAHNWLVAQFTGIEYCPPVGHVNFGSLRRLTPISREFGFDRGMPIDRYYIEKFLSDHVADIRGHVLEIADNYYTEKFGGNQVIKSDVLNVEKASSKVTIIGDLTNAEHIPLNTFDCIIITQTLHLIYDIKSALKTLYRILKPGGTLLVTFPGISHISNADWGDSGSWCWNLTTVSTQKLFEEVFPSKQVEIKAHGNVLAATCFLQGIATQELQKGELNYDDPDYEMLITIRALKTEVTL